MGHRSVNEVATGWEQGNTMSTGRVGGGIRRGRQGAAATTTSFPGGHKYGIASGDFSSSASLGFLAS